MQFDVSHQQGHKGMPTEHGIAYLIVVGRVCQLSLFQQFAGEGMGGLIVRSAIGALCCLVGLLEIAVQV